MSLETFDFEQGTEQWYAARRGMATASTIRGLITTKTMKVAANVDSRALTATIASERINGWTDDTYVSYDMMRGHEIEPEARAVYSEHYAPVDTAGFMVRNDWGFELGYSPDGLVGKTGLIETKHYKPKDHLANILADEVPSEHIAQCQTGLLVSGREWIDFISYCGGMPMWVKRIFPDPAWQEAIIDAVTQLEESVASMITRYRQLTAELPATERTPEFEGMTF